MKYKYVADKMTDERKLIKWQVSNILTPVCKITYADLSFIGQRLHDHSERGERLQFSFDRGRFQVSRSSRLDVRFASRLVAWPRRRNREYLLRNCTNRSIRR